MANHDAEATENESALINWMQSNEIQLWYVGEGHAWRLDNPPESFWEFGSLITMRNLRLMQALLEQGLFNVDKLIKDRIEESK